MKLSVAVRLGSLLVPKPESGNIEACAITMACLAVGVTERGLDMYGEISQKWPWINSARAICPACGDVMYDISILYHPFDWHVTAKRHGEMSIERLADFIASIEPSPPIHAATESQPTHDSNEGGDPGDEHVEPAQKVGR